MAAVDFKKLLQKPIISNDTMPAEMSSEVVEIITASVDKFLSTENYEKAAQSIKDALDKKFGPSWHCCVGEGFGFNVTCNAHSMIYLYYGEKLGILVFKC